MKYKAIFSKLRAQIKSQINKSKYQISLKGKDFTNNVREFKCTTNAYSNAKIRNVRKQ
jgi:cytidylate kinase